MLKEKMYVRCPIDPESSTDPRIFIMGQITEIDKFSDTVLVDFRDPFGYFQYYDALTNAPKRFSTQSVERCYFFEGTFVLYHRRKNKVLARIIHKNDYSEYYLQDVDTKEISKAVEQEIQAPFNIGYVNAGVRLKNYEFQNPVWYLGYAIVDKSEHILENAMYGFKELAGCKIYLLPHQVNTIMRCLATEPCRYMLADEVGMGKTIEAISVLKIYLLNRSKQKILIITPDALKEQWKTELFFKFNLMDGMNPDGNSIHVVSFSELFTNNLGFAYDFLIIDEIHKALHDPELCGRLEVFSNCAGNVLLLSATPVQQRKDEYLQLLQLLNPSKYGNLSAEKFSGILKKQRSVVTNAAFIFDDLVDYEDVQRECQKNNEDFSENEDAEDLHDEMKDYLDQICETLNDPKLTELCNKINFESEDGGVYNIRVALSYICSNYQIESNMIRNRRALLENGDDDEAQHNMPTRKLVELCYDLDSGRNEYEALTYRDLTEWINQFGRGRETVQKVFMPLLTAFFSSSYAFNETLKEFDNIPSQLTFDSRQWQFYEDGLADNVREIIDDPGSHEDEYCSRPIKVLDYLYENITSSKVVLFTDYLPTFYFYEQLLENIYEPENLSFFHDGMAPKELETNAYRFQEDPVCQIMLCDRTGGEGRNFQCADYIIHIDLPWDANAIEQRIGRLDRLERDPIRNTVYSVVIHTTDSFENDLFRFWNEGLNIFTKSLSGMEIIMNDINDMIISSFEGDFQYGLSNMIPEVVTKAQGMRQEVIKEQNFDVAASLFRPMNRRLKNVIDYYNANENVLFADAMMNWASLSGFFGEREANERVAFSRSSFSPKSAENALLIPPDWSEYQNNKLVLLANDILTKDAKRKNNEISIRGTFIRKDAIENDYLHFFAPGDPIFDCIVDNALHSCKGQTAAFAVLTDMDWMGFIYTWSIVPDLTILLNEGISVYSLNPYRNFISNELLITPVSFSGNEIKDETIVSQYNKIIKEYQKKDIEHLGKRSKSYGFMNIGFQGVSNIEWFRSSFPEEQWDNLVKQSKSIARKKAISQYSKKSSLSECQEEMERVLSAQEASDAYYGRSSDYSEDKRTLDFVLKALKKPKLRLDSAAFIVMKKK